INLNWSDVSDETGFGIERSIDGTNYSPLTTLAMGVTHYQDTSVSGTGLYYYRVYAINAAGNSGYSNVAQATPVLPPAAPANLVATPVSPTQIALTWSDVPDETGFRIERSTDGTNFTPLKTLDPAVTSYVDFTVSGMSTFYYRVVAFNDAGDSGYSNVASSTPVLPPDAPSNLSAAPASPTEIDLSWTDVTGETGYGIERSTDGVNFSPLTTVAAGATSYRDRSVSGSAVFYYRVYAFNDAGDSDNSNIADSTPGVPPAAPSNLVASPASASEIDLAWSDVAGESGYSIERSTNGTNFTPLASVGANVVSYHDASVSGAGIYYYRVYATSSFGNSGASNVAQSTPLQPPAAPTNLSATPATPTQINLKWDDNSGNENGFGIERSTDGVNFSALASVGAGVTTYQDTSVSGAGMFYYRVHAINAAGTSADSNIASSTPALPPAAPTNLVATPISATEIDLAWSDVSNETGYGIERSSDGTNFSPLTTVAANVTTYHDTSVSGAGVFYYRVYAINANGDSGNSNVASTTPVLPPAAPQNLAARAAGTAVIHLSWNDSAGETGFIIDRSLDGTTGWVQVGVASAGTLSFDDAGLAPATKYFYRVRATGAGGDSGESIAAIATTFAASGLAAPWVDADIGTAALAGSGNYSTTAYTGGAFALSGSGADIGASSDGFNFTYITMNGDGTIIARVEALQNTGAGAKA
ncbi:MAG TPA: hypothetical protein VFI22_00105, partial [Thermomicrobiales bacterium]|nr:hypothetical protein [Thermomicrobiales bacterium]